MTSTGQGWVLDRTPVGALGGSPGSLGGLLADPEGATEGYPNGPEAILPGLRHLPRMDTPLTPRGNRLTLEGSGCLHAGARAGSPRGCAVAPEG